MTEIDLTGLVRALEWSRTELSAQATSMGYRYFIAKDFDGWRWFRTINNALDDCCARPYATIELAQAAANADYASRVLASLNTALIEELVGALQAVDDDARHHLRGDEIHHALIRSHAIGMVRATLAKLKGTHDAG